MLVLPVCWTGGQCRCVTHGAVDGAQRHEALHVVGQGAAVGVPVRILSSLQDELLALEVVVLETHPASQTNTYTVRLFICEKVFVLFVVSGILVCVCGKVVKWFYCHKVSLRSTLHPDGANIVHPTLLDVAALRGELQVLSLEVLLLEHSHLRRPTEQMFSNYKKILTKYRNVCEQMSVSTLKKGAMPIPELTSGCIMGDLVVLYMLTPMRTWRRCDHQWFRIKHHDQNTEKSDLEKRSGVWKCFGFESVTS